jgi:hypothetical protein
VVTAADYPAFHDAMQPTLRAARLNDRRFRRTGLTPADADSLIPEALAFAAEPRSNADGESWVRGRLGDLPEPGVWWAMRHYAPIVHAPSGGPWSFGPRPAYRASPPKASFGDSVAAAPILVRRYLEGFGPASIADIAQFALLQRTIVRSAVEALSAELVELTAPDGTTLYDVPGGELPDEGTAAPPRLLGMWDSTLLAYADRSRMAPPEYRKAIARNNGDVLPTLLVNGYVAGVWRPVDDGIEATAFRRLSADDWEGLEAEAARLAAFLAERERRIYIRYNRWWSHLPETADGRLLGR